jgi:hypothetical protein
MLLAIALNTGTGPGTIVGGKTVDNSTHTRSKETIERILGSVVIANEIRRYNFEDAIADDAVYELQVVVL